MESIGCNLFVCLCLSVCLSAPPLYSKEVGKAHFWLKNLIPKTAKLREALKNPLNLWPRSYLPEGLRSQTNEMVKRASKTIWVLRRMKSLGVDQDTLVNYWKAEGRVHLEMACPVWHSGLTLGQSRDLDRAPKNGHGGHSQTMGAFTFRTAPPAWARAAGASPSQTLQDLCSAHS